MYRFIRFLEISLLTGIICSYGCVAEVSEEQAQQVRASVQVQELQYDSVEGEPSLARNFYFVIDGSGSMSYSDCGNEFDTRMKAAKWAVSEFLKGVPVDVNLGLLVFDGRGKREVVALGPDNQQTFLSQVKSMSEDGGTPLAESIHTGVDKLVAQKKKQLGYGEFRLVVVTDGDAAGLPGAAKYAMRYEIPIYTIGMCMGRDHPLSVFSVSYQSANSSADLTTALQETVAEIEDFDITEFKN